MKHEEIQDLLEGYVDESLDRPTRKLVDEHLATCEECQAILDHVEPVDLSAIGPTGFDERAMQRMVRRSIFRVAVDTILILFAGLVTVWLLSVFVLHPLVINRGGRAAYAVRATIDMTTMVNPGVVVTGGETQPNLFSRQIELDVVVPVGSGSREVGPARYRLGALSLTHEFGGPLVPYLDLGDFIGVGPEQVASLGGGTVATVRIDFTDPISIDEAQSIADDSDNDIRVVWAGFDIGSPPEAAVSPTFGNLIGYSTCLRPGDRPSDENLGAYSAGFSREYTNLTPSSIATALTWVKESLAKIGDSEELTSAFLDASWEEGRQILDTLSGPDPGVRTLVITGPAPEISEFLSDPTTPENVTTVLAVDFYNWSTPVCGR